MTKLRVDPRIMSLTVDSITIPHIPRQSRQLHTGSQISCKQVKPATAKAYISALRSLHLQHNYNTSAFDDPRIELILKRGKRIHDEGARRIRLPLTSEILSRLIQYIPNDEDGLNLKAAFCMAYAGFLRSGEFMWEI